jgi:hypothetical protein
MRGGGHIPASEAVTLPLFGLPEQVSFQISDFERFVSTDKPRTAFMYEPVSAISLVQILLDLAIIL